MSTIASMQRESVGSTVQVPVPHAQASRPAAAAAPAAAPAATDQVKVNQTVNPYEGFSKEATRVQVDRWRKGPNDSIERILRNQGYSHQEIYRKDGNGKTLIQRVAQANNLRDPNLIRPGQGLVVPQKEETAGPKPEAAPQPAPAPKSEAAPQPAPAPKPEAAPQPAPAPKPEAAPQPAPAPKPEAAPQPAPAPRPEAAPQPAPAPRPEAAPQPQAGDQEAELAQKESAEVGLLLQGVKDKKFTRQEFQALNTTANQYTELRSRYTREEPTTEQVRELTQVQHQFGQMYARFLADDKAKISFRSGDSPAAQFRGRQNEEGGQLYDQFVGQQLDEATITARLLSQRQLAAQFGTDNQ